MVKLPGTNIALLTKTSKMNCLSWSLPAGGAACPSMNGTICNSCYAKKGFYCYPNVENAQQKRFEWSKELCKTNTGAAKFAEIMITAITADVVMSKQPKYFRIHDSGDFFNVRYTAAWKVICEKLPTVKFWAPTRRWQSKVASKDGATAFKILTEEDSILQLLVQINNLSNAVIKPSALDFDTPAPVIPGLNKGSGSLTTLPNRYVGVCPASIHGTSCDENKCRTCWDSNDEVYYIKH